jgi:outer membrane receptor for ferrienterochelin and colicins
VLKNFCYTIILICIGFSIVNGQNKLLKASGIILDYNSKPISYVNIKIQGTSVGTSSNDKGEFEIKNLKPGKYILIVSGVGFETQERTIEVNEENITDLKFFLKQKNVETDPVVVTGTRSEKNLLSSPVRTEVIKESEIKKSAFTRLDQVLYEQPGLALIDEPWGRGVQLQGLDPDYSLVLIDGEPLIGRNAGTLDLSRFMVSSLKQVEIVKGPSSSLYGSEALAGVINLITEMPEFPYQLKLQSFYKTNNTIDIIANLALAKDNLVERYDKLSASFFFDRLSSDGYKFNPASVSLTAPRFSSYTLSPQIKYRFNDSSLLKLGSRIFLQEQKNTRQVIIEENSEQTNDVDNLTDWNNSLSFEHRFTPSIKSEIRLYLARYLTDSKSTIQNNESIHDQSRFDQYLYKGELKNDFILNKKNYLAAGAGYFSESVEADRIYGGKEIASSYYLFVQEEWIPNEIFDFVIGARFDDHSEYASKLSPKFSVLVKPLSFLKIRTSVGGGFKAPTLQQLYLDFTNAQAGYSVYGSSNIQESFSRLEEQGQIQKTLIDPGSIEKIRAENSIGFNLGVEFTPGDFVYASVNLFRNNVRDLIEASPIAVKTNGQSVFTYFNLNKIYTQGFETAVRVNPFKEFSITISYQYLESGDEKVIEQIKNGEISKVGSNGRIRLVRESEYGGLFNRSKHSGTVRADYQNKDWGLAVNMRGVIRGRYGFGDANGNGILDDNSEYVPDYAIWNFTITQQVIEYLDVQFGIENTFDKTNPEFIPSLSGRIIYGGIQFLLH